MGGQNPSRGSPFGITRPAELANGDPKGQIFLFHPSTNNAHHLIPHFMFKRLPEVPEYAEMRHDMMTSL